MENHRSTLGEPPSLTRIQNEQNRDHYYLAMQIQTKATDVKDISDKDYMNDVCPYAAFKISKPPYSESSYSGNIYSGAYSSVKDSFPFRELNSDSYKIKLVRIQNLCLCLLSTYFVLFSTYLFFAVQ